MGPCLCSRGHAAALGAQPWVVDIFACIPVLAASCRQRGPSRTWQQRTSRAPRARLRVGVHLFISHTWRTGQDQPAALKLELQAQLPKAQARIFLDVDDLEDMSKLEDHIAASKAVLLFMSKGYFLSRACLIEARACRDLKKPLILVQEADRSNGGASLPELFSECPDDLREYVFGDATQLPSGPQSDLDVIVWNRSKEFHLVSLIRIAEALLNACSLPVAIEPPLTRLTAHSPSLKRQPSALHRKPRTLYSPSALAEQPLALSGQLEVMISSANPAAHDLANSLSVSFQAAKAEGKAIHKDAALVVSLFPPSIDMLLRHIDASAHKGVRICMLLLLDKHTFALNEQGDSVAQHGGS